MEFDHPMNEVIRPYIQKYQRIAGYFTEDSKSHYFFQSHPKNGDSQDVLLKIGEVRDRELIRAEAHELMVSHIVSLDIDNRLIASDARLVNEIAGLTINGQTRTFYSFASRYCNSHNPASYPIYDKILSSILILYFKRIKNIKLNRKELLDYPQFKSIMEEFKGNYYSQFNNYRELDKFLWVYGREILVDFRKKNNLSDDPERDPDLNF